MTKGHLDDLAAIEQHGKRVIAEIEQRGQHILGEMHAAHHARMQSIDELAERGLMLDTFAANKGTGVPVKGQSQALADALRSSEGLENLATLNKDALERTPRGRHTRDLRGAILGNQSLGGKSANEVIVEVASGRTQLTPPAMRVDAEHSSKINSYVAEVTAERIVGSDTKKSR